jgi:hypothetical protein
MLALASLISGGRSFGIVPLRTTTLELFDVINGLFIVVLYNKRILKFFNQVTSEVNNLQRKAVGSLYTKL